MSIIITKWTTWDDTLTVEESNVIGALGGFFKEGMRWKDYIDRQPQDWWVYLEAIRAEVIAKNHRFCGDIHQQMRIPVFSDGKVGRFSYRAWGDLMAAIWAEAENNNYRYMDFYCTGSGFTERGTTCPGCGIRLPRVWRKRGRRNPTGPSAQPRRSRHLSGSRRCTTAGWYSPVSKRCNTATTTA